MQRPGWLVSWLVGSCTALQRQHSIEQARCEGFVGDQAAAAAATARAAAGWWAGLPAD